MSTAQARRTVPLLQNGDRLTRDEFERRYNAMPTHVKAELIEGVVYMPSPVTDKYHAAPQFDLIGWLSIYRAATPGVSGGDNGTLRLDMDNEPQPDAYLRIVTECGGQSTIDSEDFVQGAPEFVAEVAATSASYDLNAKLNVYRRNGVREYLVWRTFDAAIDWFMVREGRYDHLAPGNDGILRSQVLPGLWLDPAALLRGDLATVIKTAQQGTSTPEHAAFVKQLQSSRNR